MDDYVFSDQKFINDVIQNKNINLGNLYSAMNQLAKYNYFVLGLDKRDNYDKINEFLKKQCLDYSEVSEYKTLDRCINRVKKYKWRDIEKVSITKSEINRILSLGDDRKEKIAFVLLSDAKYNQAIGKCDYDASFLSVPKIYSLARVTMPVAERNLFLSFLYDENMVIRNTNPSFKGRILTYVHGDGDVVIELNENNYKELAFTYMNYKYGGYKECEQCGRLIKSKGNKRYCAHCSKKYKSDDLKTVVCADCGVLVHINAKDTKTYRCKECQYEENKRIKREYWAKNHID